MEHNINKKRLSASIYQSSLTRMLCTFIVHYIYIYIAPFLSSQNLKRKKLLISNWDYDLSVCNSFIMNRWRLFEQFGDEYNSHLFLVRIWKIHTQVQDFEASQLRVAWSHQKTPHLHFETVYILLSEWIYAQFGKLSCQFLNPIVVLSNITNY